MEDLYGILGVEKTATQDDIKKAYRNLSKKHHPDVGGNEEEFKKISSAYGTLSDEQKRKEYDNKDSFVSMFQNMGGFRRPHRKGRDIRFDLSMTLEEFYRGVDKKINFTHAVSCETCNGTGGIEQMCDQCGGNGIVTQIIDTQMGRMMNQRTCQKCRGEGKIILDPCKICNGGGSTLKHEQIELKVPEGVENGHTFLVRGGGDFIRGGISGDLYVFLHEIEDPNQYRTGNDLYKKINLSYIDFILGNDYILETFDGKIKINIPQLSKVGENLRIKGKGFNKNGSQGDMILNLDIVLPTEVSDKEKELLTEIKNLKNESI